jgi:hypothetical protein
LIFLALFGLVIGFFKASAKIPPRGIYSDVTLPYHSWFAIPFLEMSVCRLLYHGIFTLICPNMSCAVSVDSACVRILWKLRQQRGLKVVLAYVTNVLVKANMFKTTRCTLSYFAKTIGFVSWGSISPFCLRLLAHFLRVLHTQPSSRMFWLMAYSLNSVNAVNAFIEDLSAAQPFLLQQVNNQQVHNFLS